MLYVLVYKYRGMNGHIQYITFDEENLEIDFDDSLEKAYKTNNLEFLKALKVILEKSRVGLFEKIYICKVKQSEWILDKEVY